MSRLIVFIFFWNLLPYFLFGQKIITNCFVLQKSIELEIFVNRFHLCNEDNMYIVDTNHLFQNCLVQRSCGKNIEIRFDTVGFKDRRTIEVYNFERKGREVKIFFHRPFTGATLILTFKRKQSKFLLKRFEIGAF